MNPASSSIVPMLQGLYVDEVLAKQQYVSHGTTLNNMGFPKLAAQAYERAEDEEKHQLALGARIALFGSAPLPFGKTPKADVGREQEIEAIFAAELPLELSARNRYEAGILLCVEVGDNDTRDLLVANLKDETEHVHEIETAQHQIELVGMDNFAAGMM